MQERCQKKGRMIKKKGKKRKEHTRTHRERKGPLKIGFLSSSLPTRSNSVLLCSLDIFNLREREKEKRGDSLSLLRCGCYCYSFCESHPALPGTCKRLLLSLFFLFFFVFSRTLRVYLLYHHALALSP